jgi:hypothetical protein
MSAVPADVRSQIQLNLQKKKNRDLENGSQLITFGSKMKGKTFAEGFQDQHFKQWIVRLSARRTPMSENQKEFMDYVHERLKQELEDQDRDDDDAEDWMPISGNGQSAASSSQLGASSSDEAGAEARFRRLEEQMQHMASSLYFLTKKYQEMSLSSRES